MQPEEYKQLSAFRALIRETIEGFQSCTMQAALSRATEDFAARWDTVDPAFAKLLRGIQGQAWSMQLPQIKEVTKMVCGHLDKQLTQVDARLNR